MSSNTPSSKASGESRGKRRSLPHQVQRELLEYISDEGYQAGDQLPTEQALCNRFGASRTSIREAMKYMEILGIVSIEPGRGTFLKSFDVGNLLRNLPMQLILKPQDILEVMRVRQVMEEFCLEQAIIQGDEEGFEALGLWVEEMRIRADRGEPMDGEDTAFHRQLATMSNSPLLLVILELFWGLRRRWPFNNSQKALIQRYQRHLQIYTAVRQRDLQMARCYLVEHYSGTYKELLPALDDTIAETKD